MTDLQDAASTVSALTLAEKAQLTAGVDLWHTAAIDRVGIRALRMTDGPSGARGDRWSRGTSACVPCGTALGATWNRDLVRRVGRLLADEARTKGAQVLLAPTVNIHRHPLGGRHFESFSEDPFLTAELAVAYIGGVQERGVAAVVKHFACNDQEFERHTISVDIDDRALREIYLPPFEAAVRTAGVWGIMSAYNRLRGTWCGEHAWLLTTLLRDEWQFDGMVISDWRGTHSAGAVDAGLDIEMPGPAEFLGHHLVDAVKRGEAHEASLDRAVNRLLGLIERTTGSRDGLASGDAPGAVARAAAAEAIVLLKNDGVPRAPEGVLPLERRALGGLAVLGPLADRAAPQGGGSAEVAPSYVISPLEAVRELHPEVVHEPGCGLPGVLPPIQRRLLRGGVDVAYFGNPDFIGEPVAQETFPQTYIRWHGAPAPNVPQAGFSARARAAFVPDHDGAWRFGLASAGQARLLLDGGLIVDNFAPEAGESFFGRGSAERTVEVDLESGRTYQLEVQFRTETALWTSGLRFGAEPVLPPDALDRAAAAAASADAAIVVVGYDNRWESEGFDRPHMDLPGDQEALIRAVAAANPRTIVVVNAGAPVSMPWADDVAAILQLWFPGMEGGNALADVVFGDVNPSGRLPTSFPRQLADTPAVDHYPGQDGVVRYGEGVFVGYRHYDRPGAAEPRFCFGHGLSYTTFEYANLRASAAGEDVRVAIDVTNTGARTGQEVVQVYVRLRGSSVEQPDKQLKEFAKILLEPRRTRTVELTLPPRAFEYWTDGWQRHRGEVDILVGASSRDMRAITSLTYG